MSARSTSLSALARHATLCLVCLGLLFPLAWMLATAFKEPGDIFSSELALIPPRPTVANFAQAWHQEPLLAYVRNSLVAAGSITVLQLLTSILAAYGFAIYRFVGQRALFLLFVGTMIVPIQVVMIPNYLLMSELGWLDTFAALLVPQAASAYGVFLLRQHFRSFPRDLLDAASIDGASSWQVLWQVLVPASGAPVFALGMLLFLNAWNQYFWPLLVLNSPGHLTLPLGLQHFISAEAGNAWGPLMAAATVATLPPLALFAVAQRQIVDSFVTSGLKG